jgi:hypothetical protein
VLKDLYKAYSILDKKVVWKSGARKIRLIIINLININKWRLKMEKLLKT